MDGYNGCIIMDERTHSMSKYYMKLRGKYYKEQMKRLKDESRNKNGYK